MAPETIQSCTASGDLVSQLGGEGPRSGQSQYTIVSVQLQTPLTLHPLHLLRTKYLFTVFTVLFIPFHSPLCDDFVLTG